MSLAFQVIKRCWGGGSVLRWVLLGGWFGPVVGFALGAGSVLQWVLLRGVGSGLQWILLGLVWSFRMWCKKSLLVINRLFGVCFKFILGLASFPLGILVGRISRLSCHLLLLSLQMMKYWLRCMDFEPLCRLRRQLVQL